MSSEIEAGARDRESGDGPGCPAELRKAAPEMLEALKAWAALCPPEQDEMMMDEFRVAMDMTRAVIPKAEGKP